MPDTTHIFNKVASHYDLLNSLFSLGIDYRWRKELSLEMKSCNLVLDVATGTAEVALHLARNGTTQIVGVDPSIEMLRIAQKKIGKNHRIFLVQGKNEHLPFEDNSFDGITIAFGIRNTSDLKTSLDECFRVLKEKGKIAILEFTIPQNILFKPLFLAYFRYIMPLITSIFGTSREYTYLSESVERFPQREHFINILEKSGFTYPTYRELTMGIASIYTAIKQ